MTRAEFLLQEKTRLAEYILAEAKILKGQAYTIGNRALTRADLEYVQKQIDQLNINILKLSRGKGIRVQRVVVRD